GGYMRRAKVHSPGRLQSGGSGMASPYSTEGDWRNARWAKTGLMRRAARRRGQARFQGGFMGWSARDGGGRGGVQRGGGGVGVVGTKKGPGTRGEGLRDWKVRYHALAKLGRGIRGGGTGGIPSHLSGQKTKASAKVGHPALAVSHRRNRPNLGSR